jgi:uncharacterized membrane protein YhiD involved in acid resistance
MTGLAPKTPIAAALVVTAALVLCLAPFTIGAHAAEQFPPAVTSEPAPETTPPPGALHEVREAFIRLPLAAVLGTILALRPRHRGQRPRNALVVQTQIMLAVVGAVIMLVVGQSLARAFGIVGAANLIRYRSTIDDPKEAVVMLCALAAGLASGVGLYELAPFATLFMTAVLWVVEYFEPTARKRYELEIGAKDLGAVRRKIEDVMTGFNLDFELLAESEDGLKYGVATPVNVRTRDVSDTIRLVCGGEDVSIEWDEKRAKK